MFSHQGLPQEPAKSRTILNDCEANKLEHCKKRNSKAHLPLQCRWIVGMTIFTVLLANLITQYLIECVTILEL